jgi:hypothetical protein
MPRETKLLSCRVNEHNTVCFKLKISTHLKNQVSALLMKDLALVLPPFIFRITVKRNLNQYSKN